MRNTVAAIIKSLTIAKINLELKTHLEANGHLHGSSSRQDGVMA